MLIRVCLQKVIIYYGVQLLRYMSYQRKEDETSVKTYTLIFNIAS